MRLEITACPCRFFAKAVIYPYSPSQFWFYEPDPYVRRTSLAAEKK